MRFVEIRGNLLVPISNEENLLLEKIRGSIEPVRTLDLDPRQRELARQMVHRGVLSRVKIDDASCYLYNDLDLDWEI